MNLRGSLKRRAVDFLTRPLPHYDHHTQNDWAGLRSHIRKGDILLVEGDSRVAVITKYLTQSSWSHLALYVGDELLRREDTRSFVEEQFGDSAGELLIEAMPEGVVASELSKYSDFNIRLLRPHRLRTEHLEQVLDEAIASMGWRYDLRNIVDLMRYFAVLAVAPARRENRPRLGSRAPTEVICSSLIGQIFHRVGFPILPRVELESGETRPDAAQRMRPPRSWKRLLRRGSKPGGLYHRRHPTLLTPRDFDLSPFFEIVKFNVVADGNFDYRKIRWAGDGDAEENEGNLPRPSGRRGPQFTPILPTREMASERQKSLKQGEGKPK